MCVRLITLFAHGAKRHQVFAPAWRQSAPPPHANLALQETPIMIIIYIISIHGFWKRLDVLQQCSNALFCSQELTHFPWSAVGSQAKFCLMLKSLLHYIAFLGAFPIFGLLSPTNPTFIVNLNLTFYFQMHCCSYMHSSQLINTYLKLSHCHDLQYHYI